MENKSLLAPTAEDEASIAYPSVREIKGIGAAAEKNLFSQGIRTVDKLVNLSVPELAALSGTPAKTIKKKDWLGQARQLVQTASPPEDETTNNDNGQHYARFSLELMLNEDNSVRRTTIFNITNKAKKKAEEKWEGWDEERLVAVIADMAGLRRSSVKAGLSAKPENRPGSPTESPSIAKGKIQLRQLDVLSADTDKPCHLVPHDQPFQLYLVLDLVDIDALDDSSLNYTATIYAKRLGTGERHLVTKQKNSVSWQNNLSIPIEGVSMPPGDFRLQTVVNLSLPQTARNFPPVNLEGGILQVY